MRAYIVVVGLCAVVVGWALAALVAPVPASPASPALPSFSGVVRPVVPADCVEIGSCLRL